MFIELKVTKTDADTARKHESTEKTPVLESLQKVDTIVSSEATPFVPGSEFVVNRESFGSLQKGDTVDQNTQPTEGVTKNETSTESIGEKEKIDKEFPILQCKSENETVAGKVETTDLKCDFVDAETQTQVKCFCRKLFKNVCLRLGVEKDQSVTGQSFYPFCKGCSALKQPWMGLKKDFSKHNSKKVEGLSSGIDKLGPSPRLRALRLYTLGPVHQSTRSTDNSAPRNRFRSHQSLLAVCLIRIKFCM